MYATGTNTATIDKVVAMTAKPISLVASRAARIRGLPISRWRWVFSITTIASSTKMPIESESASMVMLLSVKPMKSMNAKVPITEVGIASAEMKVARQSCKNTQMISTVRIDPKIRSISTSSIDFLMKVELSLGIA